MAIFNSYVKLPEGMWFHPLHPPCFLDGGVFYSREGVIQPELLIAIGNQTMGMENPPQKKCVDFLSELKPTFWEGFSSAVID